MNFQKKSLLGNITDDACTFVSSASNLWLKETTHCCTNLASRLLEMGVGQLDCLISFKQRYVASIHCIQAILWLYIKNHVKVHVQQYEIDP